MGKVVNMPVQGNLTENETLELYRKYPDLERLMGDTYKLRKRFDYVYVADHKDIELGVDLFISISRTYNL
jgi:hypothetical protein